MIKEKGQRRWTLKGSFQLRAMVGLMSLEIRTSNVSESQQWSVAFLFPKGIGTTESALHG